MNLLSKNILTKPELQQIAERIRVVEKNTIGEIRVSIQHKRTPKDKDLSLYELAIKNFYQLSMDKTKDKTGVLIYILLKENKFQIVGDEGIHKKVHPEFWSSIAAQTSELFKKNNFFEGISFAINEIGAILQKEFPMKPGDANELPNEVIIS